MINVSLLKKTFLKYANQKVILKKAQREKSELNSKPKITFLEVPLYNCILKKSKGRYETSETGTSEKKILKLIRIDDGTVFSIGDKVEYKNVEYSITSPPFYRNEIEGFTTILVELENV